MTRTDGRIQAIELKLSPNHTAESLEILSRRLTAFVGPIGSAAADDEPDVYFVDGQEVSGAEMWKAAQRSSTFSVPRPPVVARFVSADPVRGPQLGEMRHEALLHQLRADVLDLKQQSPTPVAPVPPARRRGGRQHRDVDALLGRVENKIVDEMRRQRATEADIRNALHDRLFSQHSAGLAQIIKEELRVTISERTIRRKDKSRKYKAWAVHRTPTAAPSIDTDVGPAYSHEGGETAARSAAGHSVAASKADAAYQSLLEGELSETKPGTRGCRTVKNTDERRLEKDADEILRAAGLNPSDFQAD